MKFITMICAIALSLAASSAPSVAADEGDYGTTDFNTSANPEAHAVFIKGLLQMHSFEYNSARESFQLAQSLQEDYAMAYWGEALTNFHHLWGFEDTAAANAVLKRLGANEAERAAKAPTAREKAYIHAIHRLTEKGTKRERTKNYMDALQKLNTAYPDDLDGKALYALSIIANCHDGRDFVAYMKAGAITEEILDVSPRHPGGLHYNIHSFDDPIHAPLGKRAAAIFATVAPGAVHALHMPTHIFLAEGDFEGVRALNRRAFTVSTRRDAARGGPADGETYHVFSWLVYSLAQMGEYDKVRELLKFAQGNMKDDRDRMAIMNFENTRAHLIVQSGQCDENILNVGVDMEKAMTGAKAVNSYILGSCALQNGNLDKANEYLAKLPVVEDPSSLINNLGIMSRGIVPTLYNNMLKSQILVSQGKAEEAVEILKHSVEMENKISFGIGPISPVKPTAEMLGEVLVGLNRLDEAKGYYEQSLARYPKRTLSQVPFDKISSGILKAEN